MAHFRLDEQLARDSIYLAGDGFCHLRLMNDQRFPWLLLIPQVSDKSEIFELSRDQQRMLWDASALVAHTLKEQFSATKINVAALGNVVRQLHVHHIARFSDDPAWPGPVWGFANNDRPADIRYSPQALESRAEKLADSPLTELFTFASIEQIMAEHHDKIKAMTDAP